jgi:PIN domain nuclease of toxin-antitoxin system
VRLLLDTAAFIFAIQSPERLSRRVRAAIENSQTILELSAVSLVEIAIKSGRGKLNVSAEVTREALDELGIRVLPYTSQHAFRLFALPLHHRDPFDRQIITQALVEEVPVVTPDSEFSLYPGLKVMW